MADKLYDLMDWADVEAVVYSEMNHPRRILGPRVTKDGVLIQCFFPGREKVMVKTLKDRKNYRMKMQDESGFFAILLPGQELSPYVYVLEEEGKFKEYYDPYAFPCQVSEEMERSFGHGICYDVYETLGAHPKVVDGVKGVSFAVWAPGAQRVSVVGDFNDWDGRMHPMEYREGSGIYEIFVPGVPTGALYKYEIKLRNRLVYLKADPYGNGGQLRPDNASVVTDLTGYEWKDKEYLKERKRTRKAEKPIFVYEVHLGSFMKPEDGREFYNYREIAPKLASYVKEMGYTHVELMPVMEHPYDASWGYQVTGYYAPTSRYGTAEDFMAFVDMMHQEGIGVILDWVPAHFPRDTFGLASFDGTCLYEHVDPRQGEHPHWGTLIFNYGRPQVKNFLIANGMFWADVFHVDGIRADAVASMLYLDYGKQDGQWVANIYGGNENLEAMEFLKHLNSMMKKMYGDVLMIAEESTAWPMITKSVQDGGLGFDYKWNMGWMNDFLGYLRYDPVYRGQHHDELTFSMVYAYSEKFMLSLSHDEFVHEKGTLLSKMPGEPAQQFANVRAALGFMMTHPGKKLLFMGQDFAQKQEWAEDKSLHWELLAQDEHKKMQDYVKAFVGIYRENPALYELDYDPDGFEWINTLEWEKNIVSFVRRGKARKDCLLVVCNFSALSYTDYQIGVPYPGKYKEILNSDAEKFGGNKNVNPRVKMSKKISWDDRAHSINIKVPPLGIAIFKYSPAEKKATNNTIAKKKSSNTSKNTRDLKKELETSILYHS